MGDVPHIYIGSGCSLFSPLVFLFLAKNFEYFLLPLITMLFLPDPSKYSFSGCMAIYLVHDQQIYQCFLWPFYNCAGSTSLLWIWIAWDFSALPKGNYPDIHYGVSIYAMYYAFKKPMHNESCFNCIAVLYRHCIVLLLLVWWHFMALMLRYCTVLFLHGA